MQMDGREPAEPLLAAARPLGRALDSTCQEQQQQRLPLDASLFSLPWIASANPFAPQPTSLSSTASSRPWPANLTVDIAAAASATASTRTTATVPTPGRSSNSTSCSPLDTYSASSRSAHSSRNSLGACLSAVSAATGLSPSSPASSRSTSPRSRNNKPSMPGRPATKRPVDGGESSGSDESPAAIASNAGQTVTGKLKLPRLDRGAEDFSSVVKNRLQSYTRTGQACDRCKVSLYQPSSAILL